MRPDDPRHGTTRGHAAGCRELCCRRARNDDETRRRKYRDVLGVKRSVDATGTVRRLRALMALGWPSAELARRCGWSHGNAVLETTARKYVYIRTAATVAEVYDDLCLTVGPSRETRSRALAKSWAPPLAWDDIDDPNEAPRGVGYVEFCPNDIRLVDEVDEVVVRRILNGDWRLPCTRAEKEVVVARWPGSRNDLARLTGWKVERYVRPEVAA